MNGLRRSSGGPADERRRQVFDGANAQLLHGHLKLRAQDLEGAFHSRLTEGAEAPEIRSSDADGAGADGDRLGDVRSTAKSAVDEHGNAPTHGFHDLGRAAIVDRPLSSPRAPWFETMSPSTPFSTHSLASS